MSWPGLARASTAGGADRGKDVDGRHKAGHDTRATGLVVLARMRTSRAMTGRRRGRCVSTKPRLAVVNRFIAMAGRVSIGTDIGARSLPPHDSGTEAG